MEHEELERLTTEFLFQVMDEDATIAELRSKRDAVVRIVSDERPAYRKMVAETE